MPLAEFFRMARGKLESAKRKETTYTSDISQILDNECAELLWENGQITVQGQSSRARRSPPSKDYQSNSSKLRDKDSGNGTLVDFTTLVPSKELGLDHNDDMAPWLNYPVDDFLQGDYSNILPELSGVTVIEQSAQNKFSSIDKRNNSNLTIRGSNGASAHNGMSSERENLTKIPSEIGETSRSRTGLFQTLSFEGIQTSIPSLRLGNSGITNTNLKLTLCAESNQAQTLGGGFPNTRIPKQDTGVPNTNSPFVNFSHFRPSALVRANLHNLNAMPGPGTLGAGTNCSESKLIDSSVNLRKEMGVHSLPSSAPPKEDPKPVAAIPIKDLRPAERAEAVCQENSVKKDKLLGEMGDGEKIIEPVVASSSVCSGNGTQGASDDPAQILKRKCRDIDDCEGQSEDIEEESIGARKAASGRGGTGSKRGRAAEVHNLSERRRRDRINEKMRALQELIPNCNKVDKASMLDEAIEYLKTLQLQLQIMSMGAGLYMQPMILPTGIQQMQAAHMARFSPMAVGIGMGMGFGTGMDMNASPRCPMIQVPTMQGTHFTGPHLRPISGPGSFQAMGGSNLPVYRHPAQGLPLSAAHANLSSSVGMNANGMAEIPHSGTLSNANDLVQSTHSVSMHNNEASSSENPKAAQHWPTNEGFRESNLVPKNDQPPDTGSSDDAILTEENDMDVTET